MEENDREGEAKQEFDPPSGVDGSQSNEWSYSLAELEKQRSEKSWAYSGGLFETFIGELRRESFRFKRIEVPHFKLAVFCLLFLAVLSMGTLIEILITTDANSADDVASAFTEKAGFFALALFLFICSICPALLRTIINFLDRRSSRRRTEELLGKR